MTVPWTLLTFYHHYVRSGTGLRAASLVKRESQPDFRIKGPPWPQRYCCVSQLESERCHFQCRKKPKDTPVVPSNYKDKKSLWGKNTVFICLGLVWDSPQNRFQCGGEGCHRGSREIYGQALCSTFPPIALLFMPGLSQFIQLLS